MELSYQDWLTSIIMAAGRLHNALPECPPDVVESITEALKDVDEAIWPLVEWAEEA